MKALILAGGSGVRLWPISRSEYPKQFLRIGGKESFLQKTVHRVLSVFPVEDVYIITNRSYQDALKEQLTSINPILGKNIVCEPLKKNTAPAIIFAVKFLMENRGASPDEPIFVCPSDQTIEPQDRFSKYLERALWCAEQGRIATFGIKPLYPETGYGYIQTGSPFAPGAMTVERFVEKPNLEKAREYLEAGNFFWNSGMFAFQAQTLWNEIQSHCPDLFRYSETSLKSLENQFEKLPEISIDYAVMEKSKKTVVLPVDLSWSDVGSWDKIFDMLPKDSDGNACVGSVVQEGTKDSMILSDKRLIAAVGLEQVIVIETPDAVLVAKKEDSQKVKEIVAKLRSMGRKEINEHTTIHRPWGAFTILESGPRYKIKKITVLPEHRLSLQMHFHRSEHWVVVQGTAKATVQGKETLVHENESIYIPKGAIHTLSNPGKVALEIIETQVGEYLGEDDIVRFEDAYGRTSS